MQRLLAPTEGRSMFLLIALVLATFVVALGTVLLISVDRAAALVDDSSIDMVLARK